MHDPFEAPLLKTLTAPLDRRDGRLIQGLMRTSSLSLEEWQMLWVDEGAEC